MCKDDSSERYFGAEGALQCLLDGVGDVAFIDHVELHGKILASGGKQFLKNYHKIINYLITFNWFLQLDMKATDFKLLCTNGSTMSNLTNYQACNWGKIPSNQILTRSGDEWEVKREDVRLTLLKISDTLGPGGKAVGVLKLFGPYFGNNDFLFKDTSIGLCDYKSVPEFKSLISDFDYCTTSTAPSLFSSFSILIFSCVALIMARFS